MRIGFWPLLLILATAAGCEPRDSSESMASSPRAETPTTEQQATATGDSVPPTTAASDSNHRMVVHKSPTCGCCLAWADQMRAAGFEVEIRDVDDLTPIKTRLGVPPESTSCHTTEIAGYFVEGHVPAEDIERLLAERPDARGLAVPGMPLGSPGMEVPSGATQPFAVLLVGTD